MSHETGGAAAVRPAAAAPESPFLAPLERCLSAALSRGMSRCLSHRGIEVSMLRLESHGVDGLAPPKGPVTSESGPQGKVRPYTIIRDPQAWLAAEWEGREAEWVLELTPEDVAAVEDRVSALEAAGTQLVDIKRAADFPLSAPLEARLADMRQQLIFGRGFHLVRGIPVERMTERQAVMAYMGLGAHIGYRGPQSKKGNLVSHVKLHYNEDFGEKEAAAAKAAAAAGLKVQHGGPDGLGKNAHMKGHANNLEFDWHTDGQADILALLCVAQAKEGGVSGWSSTIAVHNEMLRRGRADLVACMAGPGWARDRGQYQDLAPGDVPVWEMPAFWYHDGRLAVHFHAGQTRMCHARYPDLLGPLTEQQEEAIAMFTEIASDPAFQFTARLHPGEVLFLNNEAVLHRRSAFEDGDGPGERRHLVRLWLAVGDVPHPAHLDFPRSYTTGYNKETFVGLMRPDPEAFHVPRSDGNGNH